MNENDTGNYRRTSIVEECWISRILFCLFGLFFILNFDTYIYMWHIGTRWCFCLFCVNYLLYRQFNERHLCISLFFASFSFLSISASLSLSYSVCATHNTWTQILCTCSLFFLRLHSYASGSCAMVLTICSTIRKMNLRTWNKHCCCSSSSNSSSDINSTHQHCNRNIWIICCSFSHTQKSHKRLTSQWNPLMFTQSTIVAHWQGHTVLRIANIFIVYFQMKDDCQWNHKSISLHL